MYCLHTCERVTNSIIIMKELFSLFGLAIRFDVIIKKAKFSVAIL